MIRTKIVVFVGEVFSEYASRYPTSVVSLEAQNILEIPFKRLSSMCCVYFVWMCISWFWLKLLVSSGEVFSEQTGPHEAKMVSLEAQNILEVPFKGLGSMCGVYCVWMCISLFWPKIAVFVGRGLLGTGGRCQTSVLSLEAQNITEVPFKGLSSMCCIYFVWTRILWFRPKIAVIVGSGLLGTGESISDECGVIGSAEHLRSTI